MIRIEEIRDIPEVAMTPYSAFEFGSYSAEARKELVRGSKIIRLVFRNSVPILVGGLYRGSLISIPYLWILLTPEFSSLRISELRSLVHELSLYAPQMETLIDESNDRAVRLAKLFHFSPTETLVQVANTYYRMFRRSV